MKTNHNGTHGIPVHNITDLISERKPISRMPKNPQEVEYKTFDN